MQTARLLAARLSSAITSACEARCVRLSDSTGEKHQQHAAHGARRTTRGNALRGVAAWGRLEKYLDRCAYDRDRVPTTTKTPSSEPVQPFSGGSGGGGSGGDRRLAA
uniref:Putative secreted protein n=1 Tax=Anopheles marajoara TaxID=58244 RepID=A0A2M4C883_9DIPT